MNLLRFAIVASAAIAITYSTSIPFVLQASAQTDSAQTAPDNSKSNKDHAQTADSQSNAKADRQITASVRKAILADKDLSTYAHNIKIITLNGAVTLKGPVKSEDEKQKIASDTTSVVSADQITNELTVKQ
jgi:hyperosmotically inducible periplasmic protein